MYFSNYSKALPAVFANARRKGPFPVFSVRSVRT